MTKQGRAAAYLQQRETAAVTFEVELPSGAVFLLRKPELQVWVMSGELPMSVAAAMERTYRSDDERVAAFMSLTVEEREKATRFARKLITYVCVEPRIGTERDDDTIIFTDLSDEDATFLVQWAQSVGGETADAVKFRKGRESASVGRTDGKKLRKAAKRDPGLYRFGGGD